ncbi:unnamed protein product [Closterium sp. NIES-54]
MDHMLTPQELLSLGGSADAAAATAAAAVAATAAAAVGRKGKGSGSGAGRSGGLGGAGGGKPLKFSYEWPAMGVPGGKWVADHALPWTAAAGDKDEEKDKDKDKEKGTAKGKDKAKSKAKDKEQEEEEEEEEEVDAWEGFKGRLKEHWGRVVEEDYEPLLGAKQGGGDSSSSGSQTAKGSKSSVNGGDEGGGKRKRGKTALAAAAAAAAAVSSPEETALGAMGASDGKAVKLYTDFYQSDIIVASPIGLVTKLGEAMEDSEKDMDFLSSIEIVIVDQADVILMQNWAHVEAVFAQLNKLPVKQHGTDFMRVREWGSFLSPLSPSPIFPCSIPFPRYLNGWAAHYRQSIVLSAFSHPCEFHSTLPSFCECSGATLPFPCPCSCLPPSLLLAPCLSPPRMY